MWSTLVDIAAPSDMACARFATQTTGLYGLQSLHDSGDPHWTGTKTYPTLASGSLGRTRLHLFATP